ncbi:MAG: GNAT family N-acetyltransferase [Patescibacteria group bacterium]
MGISELTQEDIKKAYDFIKGIIFNTKYYSVKARKAEIERFKRHNLLKELKDKSNLYLIAKDKGKIIGFCNGYYEAGTFWIDWAGIDKNYRRNGIAVKLLNFLENKLKKQGVHKIWCDCRTSNKESKALLKKLNLKKITTIKNHWYNQDFILWQKFI